MSERRQSDQVVRSAQDDYDSLINVLPETPCPYLPGRLARNEAYLAGSLDGEHYERLMGRFFRRSGDVVYRPRCRGCTECQPLRVPVATFRLTRSLRRVWAKNREVAVDVATPVATREKFDIFLRYLDHQHDGTMSRAYESYREFLYESPLETLEFRYRLGARTIGLSIADRCPNGLSSVYMYFDPDERSRSLGTLSVLHEIEYCRRVGMDYYYLGYYVAGCATMDYKARFRPNEILVAKGCWEPFRE